MSQLLVTAMSHTYAWAVQHRRHAPSHVHLVGWARRAHLMGSTGEHAADTLKRVAQPERTAVALMAKGMEVLE